MIKTFSQLVFDYEIACMNTYITMSILDYCCNPQMFTQHILK